MSSLAKRMAQTTETLPEEQAATLPKNKAAKPNKTVRPKSSPGSMLNWAIAQEQVEELEKHRAGTPIALSLIDPNPFQPRIEFDPIALDELAESIRAKGLIQAIVVRKHPTKEGRYQIVVGERRFRAFKMLDMAEIPTSLVDHDDETLAFMALAENLNREDLTDFEISQSVIMMRNVFPQASVMAEKLGISRKQLYRFFAFENLPDYVLTDLRTTPTLLGATVVDELSSILKEHKDTAVESLKELWPRFKEGQFQQNKLAAKLRSALSSEAQGVSRRSLELFSKGKKVGVFQCDSKGLKLSIKSAALTQDVETRFGALLTELFPDHMAEPPEKVTVLATTAPADEQAEQLET